MTKATPTPAATSFLELAQQRNLLLASPCSDRPTPTALPASQCGVSVLFLRELSKCLDGLVPPDASTASVVSSLIVPCTAKARRCRLHDLVPKLHVAPPRNYIVHTWRQPFKQMVEQIVHSLGPDARIAQEFVWLDIVALPQHSDGATAPLDVAAVKEVARGFEGVMTVIIDRKQLALTRSWCMFELWMWIYHNDIAKLRVCLPDSMTMKVDDVLRLEQKCRALDINTTESTVPEDRTSILSSIRKTVGMKIMQRNLNEALLLAIRVQLRWSERFEDFALYTCVLLKAGDQAKLQEVLHGMADLHDDAVVSFGDVERCFKALENPQTKELNYEAFSHLLKDLGLDPRDAPGFWNEITGQAIAWRGGIGMEKFFDWWRSLEKGTVTVQHIKRPPVMTSEALVENLQLMSSFLKGKELPQLAEEYSRALAEHQAGRLLAPGSTLAPSDLRGNWLVASNDVVWKLHTHDYRGATAVLYTLLMWNGDLIGTNPATMEKPDTKNLPLKALCKVLLSYMELFIKLLRDHPKGNEHTMHRKFYKTCTEQLLTPDALESLLEAHRKGQISHAQVVISRAVKELEKNSVIRNMIQLKYGSRPVNGLLIVEAELSVAELLCQTKKGAAPTGALPYVNYMDRDVELDDRLVNMLNGGQVTAHMRKKNVQTNEKSALLRLGSEAEAFFKEQMEAEAEEERRRQAGEAGVLGADGELRERPSAATDMTDATEEEGRGSGSPRHRRRRRKGKNAEEEEDEEGDEEAGEALDGFFRSLAAQPTTKAKGEQAQGPSQQQQPSQQQAAGRRTSHAGSSVSSRSVGVIGRGGGGAGAGGRGGGGAPAGGEASSASAGVTSNSSTSGGTSNGSGGSSNRHAASPTPNHSSSGRPAPSTSTSPFAAQQQQPAVADTTASTAAAAPSAGTAGITGASPASSSISPTGKGRLQPTAQPSPQDSPPPRERLALPSIGGVGSFDKVASQLYRVRPPAKAAGGTLSASSSPLGAPSPYALPAQGPGPSTHQDTPSKSRPAAHQLHSSHLSPTSPGPGGSPLSPTGGGRAAAGGLPSASGAAAPSGSPSGAKPENLGPGGPRGTALRARRRSISLSGLADVPSQQQQGALTTANGDAAGTGAGLTSSPARLPPSGVACLSPTSLLPRISDMGATGRLRAGVGGLGAGGRARLSLAGTMRL